MDDRGDLFQVEERDELLSIVRYLASDAGGASSGPSTATHALPERRLREILDRYQEHAALLDPLLPELVRAPAAGLLAWLASGAPPGDPSAARRCDLLLALARARGFRVVLRLLPHGLLELRRLAAAYAADAARPPATEELLARWAAVAALLPFPLHSVDPALAPALLAAASRRLASSGPLLHAAAELLGVLLARSDIADAALEPFLANLRLVDPLSDAADAAGLGRLAAAHAFVRHADAAAARVAAPRLADAARPWLLHPSPAARLAALKLSGRAALAALPPRSSLAVWRRRAGQRACFAAPPPAGAALSNAPHRETAGGDHNLRIGENYIRDDNDNDDNVNDSDDDEVPELVDGVAQALLDALAAAETAVRWAAAKGVGRLAARLPRAYAEQLVGAVLGAVLAPGRAEDAWHGGLLALAEAAHRGALPPALVEDVSSRAVAGLRYDVRLGRFSVGQNVRDAACFVCWALPRAFGGAQLRRHVERAAPDLVAVALLDRESACRRAAAAAFQENVGRLGGFPHGIELVQLLDFVDLGSVARTYLDLLPRAARLSDYRRPLLAHLARAKATHWDPALRDLAARAFAAAAEVAVAERAEDDIAFARELAHETAARALAAAADPSERAGGALLVAHSARVLELPAALLDAFLRGDAAVVLERYGATATVRLAAAYARAPAADGAASPSSDKCAALAALLLAVPRPDTLLDDDLHEAAAAVAAAAPAAVDVGGLWAVQGALHLLGASRALSAAELGAVLVSAAGDTDAGRRRDALSCLGLQLARGPPAVPLADVATALGRGLNDYSRARRGDVGSWSRLEALRALPRYAALIGADAAPATAAGLLQRVLRVALEPLASLVAPAWTAAAALAAVVPGGAAVANAAQHGAVADGAEQRFAACVPLLRESAWRDGVLTGWAQSCFSGAESDARAALDVLAAAAGDESPVRGGAEPLRAYLGQSFVRLWRLHAHSPRIALPLVRTIAALLERRVFHALQPPRYRFSQLLAEVAAAEAGSRQGRGDSYAAEEALGAVAVLLYAHYPPSTRAIAVAPLRALLTSEYVSVRRRTAERLYSALLVDGSDEDAELLDALPEFPVGDDLRAATEFVREHLRLPMG